MRSQAAASSNRVTCVVLAAGESRRLGRPKQLLRKRLAPHFPMFAPGDYVDITVRLMYERGDRDYARTSVGVSWGDDRTLVPGARDRRQ